jgi:Mg-chelatase subunit ChlD
MISKIILILSILITSSLSYSQCLKADIIFLLDWSGSENGNGAYMADATKDFIGSLNMGPSSVKVGIIPFNSYPKTPWCVPLTYDKDILFNIVSNLGNISPSGGTDYHGAFYLSASFFEKSQVDRGESVTKIVILISDGVEDIDSESNEIINIIKSYCFVWSIGTTSKGMSDFGRERLKNICTSPEFYSEQSYFSLKSELLRLSICP